MKPTHLLLATTALVCVVSAAFAQVANISTTDLTPAGFNGFVSATSAVSRTYFVNDGNTVFYMRNSSTTPVSATVISNVTSVNVQGYGAIAVSDSIVSLPGNGVVIMGPFAKGRYNSPLYDTVTVSFTALPTTVSVSALRLPPQ